MAGRLKRASLWNFFWTRRERASLWMFSWTRRGDGVTVEGGVYFFFRRRALTRPRGERRLAAEIRVLPFHYFKWRLLASPGAMAIPDRRSIAALSSGKLKQTLFDGAPTAGPPLI